MEACGYSPAKAGELLRGQGQPGLCSELQLILGYSVRALFQKEGKKKEPDQNQPKQRC